ncbi:MAG: hypothetical protein CMJ96_00095 [Planctomycetes bacterium]|jgi:pSer/pThr/pTyr-binding forkhead associated (FHA) protein|nr:hypothetical protein [Planctomycetota bacterium]MDP6128503.1 FHA domain-containing protein [Planctomycetota bacterium]MDP7246175.1 FHA domain-containing protein [Planctomycetota bacterium]|tara:strand:+ start:23296 stop:23907 length:612 start_codon:yes stop_codon:yes gene_type:complete
MSYSKLELEITFEGVTSNLSVGGELIRVGRSRRCDVTVRDPSISRTHCSMEMRDGGVVLLDEGSANGTWVDGQRTECCRLLPGRSFDIGDSNILLVDVLDSKDAIPPPDPVEPLARPTPDLSDSLARTISPGTPVPDVGQFQPQQARPESPSKPARSKRKGNRKMTGLISFIILLGFLLWGEKVVNAILDRVDKSIEKRTEPN